MIGTDHNEAMETMKTFLSGKMTAEEFWEIYKSSETIQNILIDDEEKRGVGGKAWFSADALLQNIKNIHSYYDSAGLHGAVETYFLRNQIPVEVDNFYSERYWFLLDIQPSWLDTSENEDFLINEIIAKIPEDIKTKTQKIKWCKNKLKEYFRYDRSPPRWVQYPQWPIIDGKPLVFRKQSKEDPDDERVFFCFYDPDTNEETVVTQIY